MVSCSRYLKAKRNIILPNAMFLQGNSALNIRMEQVYIVKKQNK